MMKTRTVIALAVRVTAIAANVTSAVRAQAPLAAFAKIDVATIHRNKEMESIRAAASPNAPLGPSRLRVTPGGRLRGRASAPWSSLERVRGVADVIVVERIERPTEN